MALHDPRPIISMLNTRAYSDPQLWALLHDVRDGTATQQQMHVFGRHINELTRLVANQQRPPVQPMPSSASASSLPSIKRERSQDTLFEPSKKTKCHGGGSRKELPSDATSTAYGPVPPAVPKNTAQLYANFDLFTPIHVGPNLSHTYSPTGAATQTPLPAQSSNHGYPLLREMGGLPIHNTHLVSNDHFVTRKASLPPPTNDNIIPYDPYKPTSSMIHTHSDITPKTWKAEPHKLSKGKKAKYYGVRAGRNPGIYYDWSDVEHEVKGFRNAAQQAFRTQQEVENYMNHASEDCHYTSCASRCKDASTARQQNAFGQYATYQGGDVISYPSGHSGGTEWLAPTQDLMSAPVKARRPQPELRQPPVTMPLTRISPNSTQTIATVPRTQVCDCGGDWRRDGSKTVTCANANCEVKIYHAECVGLAKRAPDSTWKCRRCRTPPPPLPIPGQPVISQITNGPTEPPLSAQQAGVVDLILSGSQNVCYTGSAGTGKSTVLKAVVRALKYQGKTVDIVAPSGIAALAVGGQTVFSYAGWVPDTFKLPLFKIAERSHGKKIFKRLRSTDVLIIEEISMVDSDVFVRLERACREARSAAPSQYEAHVSKRLDGNLPFGGIQVVVTGDFCQLPPVKPFKFCLYCGGDELPGWLGNHGKTLTCPRCNRKYEDHDKWAFRNDAWKSCRFKCVELTEIHRQSDPVFTAILQKCRKSLPLSPEDKELLLDHKANTADAVYLRPTLAEVLRINEAAFRVLPGIVSTYECHDEFSWRRAEHPDLENRGLRKVDGRYHGREDGPLKALQDHRFEERLELKIDTLVILLVNLDLKTGLVNGAQGKVIGFQPYSESGGVSPQDQSSSYLPEAVGDYKEVRQLQLRNFVRSRNVKSWPIVRFNNNNTQIVYAQCQLSELGLEKPYSLLSRTQIPLIPAWAITVHKSQGMTLARMEVDLSRAFEREMIYVALSRCKSLEGLKVHSLPRNMDYGPNLVVQEFLEQFKPASALMRTRNRIVDQASGGDDARDPILLD